MRAKRPWRTAFMEAADLPTGVRGPVDLRQFAWLAASCFSEIGMTVLLGAGCAPSMMREDGGMGKFPRGGLGGLGNKKHREKGIFTTEWLCWKSSMK